MRKKTIKSFSLVELMVVIAIIGILSAIAVPSYRNYIKKAKVAEVFVLLAKDQQAVAAYANVNGFPNSVTAATNMLNSISGLTVCSSAIVNSCTFDQWGINVTFGSEVSSTGFWIHVLPYEKNDIITWFCGNGGGAANSPEAIAERDKILPEHCKQYIITAINNAGASTLW